MLENPGEIIEADNSLLDQASLITMGKIVGAFGIQGWIKIKTSSDLENIAHYKTLYITGNSNNQDLMQIKTSFAKNGLWFVSFKDITTRNQAEELIGKTVSINRKQLPKAAADEYYWTDLIGSKVTTKNNEYLGIVDDLMDTGANSILVIHNDDKTTLIPFVAAYVLEVDIQNKQIIVDWGLDY